MSESNQVADIVKSHLETFSANFSSTVTRSLDHLIQQHEKIQEQVISQDKRLDRLEVLIETFASKHSELIETVKEIAVNQSNIDYDRRRFSEDVVTIYAKMDEFQEKCSDSQGEIEKRISVVERKIAKVYIVAGTVGTVAAIISSAIVTVVKLIK